ncbi:MAG: hypothetical protein ABEI57_03510 [Halapricum sp.]
MVRRVHAIGLAVLIVCMAGFAGIVSGQATSAGTASYAGSASNRAVMLSANASGFARTTFTLTVYANGSVRWTTTYAKPLNESQVSEFESYADRFNTTETGLYQGFVAQANSLAATGTKSTNRTMNATNFRKRAYVDQGGFNLGTQGKVEMSFLWTNLTSARGDRVVLGDVFESGLYLGPDQRLIVEPGSDLQFSEVSPDPDSMAMPNSLRESDSITWTGEYKYDPHRPRIEFVPAGSTSTTTPGTATETPPASGPTTSSLRTTPVRSRSTTAGPAPAGGNGGGTMFVVGLIVLLLAMGTVVVYRTMQPGDDHGSAAAAETETPPDAPTPAQTEQPEPDTGAQSEDAQAPAQSVTEEDLLTDTDQVRSLLESHSGRMRQSAIVEETEWSKSKVSMLLSDMEDDDEITKLRVGRENIISLPGHEPDAARSPFDDEE